MNTSLRRVAVTIMVLIVLLLANATITQVFVGRRVTRRPAQPAGTARRVLAPAGQITAGGQLLAYSVATDGRFRFLRDLPQSRRPTPR